MDWFLYDRDLRHERVMVAARDMSLFPKEKVKILPWYDKKFQGYNIHFVNEGRIPLLRLNELAEKLRVIIILGNFVNKPFFEQEIWLGVPL